MDEEVVGYELLDRCVRRDGEQFSGHDISNPDTGKRLGQSSLSQACLGSWSDEPAQEDYPEAVDEIPKDDEEQSDSHHDQRDRFADAGRVCCRAEEALGTLPKASAKNTASVQGEGWD